MKKDAQADRRVTDLAEFRKKVQSTSSRSDSQRTLPLVSRSMLMASFSPHLLPQSATLAKCPTVVSHLEAKSRFSSAESGFQKVDSSMQSSHHKVLEFATPNGIPTLRCENLPMEQLPTPEIRRVNLRAYCKRHCGGSFEDASVLRKLKKATGHGGAYLADLLKPGSDKSFGEKAARKIEDRLGLYKGELDIPGSALRHDPAKQDSPRQMLADLIQDMPHALVVDLLNRANAAMKKSQRTG